MLAFWGLSISSELSDDPRVGHRGCQRAIPMLLSSVKAM
jgi:hypothetical protein